MTASLPVLFEDAPESGLDTGGACQAPSGQINKRRFTLVVEGGGLRGAFCAGALSVLDRLAPRTPDFVYAASAGAPSAAYLAAGQMEQAIRLWENRTYAGHLVSPAHWFKGQPLMNIDKLVAHFSRGQALDTEAFGTTQTKVVIAVTNCRTGLVDYVPLRPDNAFELLRAAMALPLAYGRVVSVDGQPYIDGGVSESIPIVPPLLDEHEDLIVVLTQPKGYRKRRSKVAERLMRWQYRNFPELERAFATRAERYNSRVEEIERLEAEGRLSVIRPANKLPASRMTRDRSLILDTIQIGRNTARNWLRDRGWAEL